MTKKSLEEANGRIAENIDSLKKELEQERALTASLNRYIEALEGKAAMQAGMLRELKRKLKALLQRDKKTPGRAGFKKR